jgi:hypothetical protein
MLGSRDLAEPVIRALYHQSLCFHKCFVVEIKRREENQLKY